jgi:hypothetical protein
MKTIIKIIVLLVLISPSVLRAQKTNQTKSEGASIKLNPKIPIPQPKSEINTISIINPISPEGSVSRTTDSTITLVGSIDNCNEECVVLVNSEKTIINNNGVFDKKLYLKPGINDILIIVINSENARSEKLVKIEYETPLITFANKVKSSAKYYGLIIGVNNYIDSEFEDLESPVKDSEELYNILTQQYSFEPGNTLIIRDASREAIIDALDRLTGKITRNDNLLIYYAGHGNWNESSKVGYWLPSNAMKTSKSNWLSNSTVVDYLKEIQAKHILLIADACFSGSIFKSRSAELKPKEKIQALYEMPSRKAMTSGILSKVPDKSAFTRFLIEKLTGYEEPVFTSEQLFASFRIAVENNSEAKPRYGEIQDADDRGGDFLFIKK